MLITLPSTSYAVIDSGYKYMYDRYNDVYRFVPLNGDTVSIYVLELITLQTHTSHLLDIAEGQIRGAVKLAFNPNQTQRDELYKARINPVVSFQTRELYYLVTKLLHLNQVHLIEST